MDQEKRSVELLLAGSTMWLYLRPDLGSWVEDVAMVIVVGVLIAYTIGRVFLLVLPF
jgi:hypothetical protein